MFMGRKRGDDHTAHLVFRPSCHPIAAGLPAPGERLQGAQVDGWLLGVVGAMEEGLEPYGRMPGAFSRCNDKVGDISPEELVAWYADMMTHKGAYA